ncbi:MAG: DNA polymerase III subunit chi [Alphaproteobacteria bacterium]
MTDIRFYHLQRKSLEDALPVLLEKILERGSRAVVMAGSAERVEALNAHLWTYSQGSFLPHGSQRDGHAEDQPVWLTTGEENPNGSDVLVLTDGASAAHIESFKTCCELFDGNDTAAVEEARRRWQAYKAAGHDLTYWQQTDEGRWEKRA